MLFVFARRSCAEAIAPTRRLDAGYAAPSFKIQQRLVAVAIAMTFNSPDLSHFLTALGQKSLVSSANKRLNVLFCPPNRIG
jgi:hypothetical protein